MIIFVLTKKTLNGGYSIKCYTGRLHTKAQSSLPFYITLRKKDTPFMYLPQLKVAPVSVRLLHPSSEPPIFSTGENKQFKPLILCHCIYSLPLITGAFLNIFKRLETYHSLSEFLLNEIEWHTFSLQRYSFFVPFVRNKPVSTQRLTSNQNSTHSNVKFRSKLQARRIYGVILNYLGIRAVLVDLTPDYSPEKFLMVLRKFESLREYAVKLISDNGAQLTVATRSLGKWPNLEIGTS